MTSKKDVTKAVSNNPLYKGSCIYWSDSKKRWIAQVYANANDNTKRRIKHTRSFMSRTDAQAALPKMCEQYQGIETNPKQMTVNQWLEKWFELYSLPHIRPSTAISYMRMLQLGADTFGNTPLADLSPLTLQKFVNDHLATHYRTAAYFTKVMKMALQKAVSLELIAKNPASDIVLPRKPYAKPFTLLTANDREKLLNAKTPLNCWKLLLRTEFATGLRRGELLALQWHDIDFDAQTLTVSRSLITGLIKKNTDKPTKTIMFSEPKTPSSRRILPLPSALCYALNAYYQDKFNSKYLHEKTDEKEPESALIFTRNDGRIIAPDYFSACFSRAKKQAGINVTFHGLRHALASEMLNAGEFSAKEIQRQLGHASVRTTLDTYAHLSAHATTHMRQWLENAPFTQNDKSL